MFFTISMLPIPWRLQSLKQRDLLGAFLESTGLGAGLGFTALMAVALRMRKLMWVKPLAMRKLIPAETLEASAGNNTDRPWVRPTAKVRWRQTITRNSNACAPSPPDLIPYTAQWNPDSRKWKWEVNLIGSKQINAWCMPGGKIAFYTGILDQLQLNDDEVAMIMGHEMAHALREHSRERLGQIKSHWHGFVGCLSIVGLRPNG